MLKTFNVDADVYEKYSKHCKKNGVSMSRQVENFLRNEVEKLNSGVKINVAEVKEAVEVKKIKINSSEFKADAHPLSKYC
ncbi:MAG: hypothetical protein Q8L29_03865 [archaeon]|nr:hypothetical protein [archaeon]